MKQIFVILFLFLVGTEAYAQKKPLAAMLPYKDERSIDSIKVFAYGTSRKSMYWRESAIQLVKNKLISVGDEEGAKKFTIDTFFAHLTFEEEKLPGDSAFSNSGWNFTDQKIDFYPSKLPYEGWAGIINYHKVRVVSFKMNCLNLLMVKNPKPKKVEIIVPKDEPLAKVPDTKADTSKKCCCCPAVEKSVIKTLDMNDVIFSTENNGITKVTGWKQQDMYWVQMPSQYYDGSQPWRERGVRIAFHLDVNFGMRSYFFCPPGGNRFISIPQNNWGFFNLQISSNNWQYQSFGNQQYGEAYYQNRPDIGDRNGVICPTCRVYF